MNDFFLADDLSGALDAAAAFHDAGRVVRIALTLEAESGAEPGDVIGFTTETRNASPEAAAAAVERAVARGRASGGRLLFKKIDSTLRGPVAAELAALAAALPAARILFCPANPRVGRTVRDGVLRVHGVPVAETEFARDPVSPVRESAIRQLLGDVATERIVIADAATEADLTAAAMRMNTTGGEWVGVGSGALARAVVGTGLARSTSWSPKPKAKAEDAPILFVCGSAHPANQTQAMRLAKASGATMHTIAAGTLVDEVVVPVVRDLRTGGLAGLQLAARDGAKDFASSRAALDAIVAVTRGAIAASGVRRLMVTGGETAFVVCGTLGVGALKVAGELEPGLVLAEAATAAGTWRFAIKPGGFGSEVAWVKAADVLRQA